MVASRANSDAAGNQLLLTSIETSRALAISPRHLWSLTKSGKISCVRIGRSVRYHVEDIERFVNEQKARNDEP